MSHIEEMMVSPLEEEAVTASSRVEFDPVLYVELGRRTRLLAMITSVSSVAWLVLALTVLLVNVWFFCIALVLLLPLAIAGYRLGVNHRQYQQINEDRSIVLRAYRLFVGWREQEVPDGYRYLSFDVFVGLSYESDEMLVTIKSRNLLRKEVHLTSGPTHVEVTQGPPIKNVLRPLEYFLENEGRYRSNDDKINSMLQEIDVHQSYVARANQPKGSSGGWM